MASVSCQTESVGSVKHALRNCTIECPFNGNDPKPRTPSLCEWVRCCLCTHWFHPTCVSLPQEETEGIWTCPTCRNIADDISSLKDMINVLLDIVRRNNHSLTQLVSDNLETQTVIKNLRNSSCAEISPLKEPVTPSRSLLIGDSLIKHIKSKTDDLEIVSDVPLLDDVTAQLNTFNKFDNIYLVTGTNDCKGDADPENIGQKFKVLLSEAKKKANKVVLSSITPRADCSVTESKIKMVNQKLIELANEENVTLINHEENFLYKNNSLDTSLYQPDKCHLSHQGITRLLGNLGLQDIASSSLNSLVTSDPPRKLPSSAKNARKSPATSLSNTVPQKETGPRQRPPPPPPAPSPPKRGRQIKFQGHRHPLSNFFTCDIELYGRTFKSSEGAYQYRKALEYEAWSTAEDIAECSRAIDAKRMGDKINTDQHWWSLRQSVMLEVITAKASQCPEFRNTLVASQGNMLVEDTAHEYWGRGKTGNGQNQLGLLLESLRSDLPEPWINTKPRRVEDNSRDPGCGYCGERGHNTSVCGHGRPIKCRNCQGHRHKEKMCWFQSS